MLYKFLSCSNGCQPQNKPCFIITAVFSYRGRVAKERGAETTAAEAETRTLFLTRETTARGIGTSASSAETAE